MSNTLTTNTITTTQPTGSPKSIGNAQLSQKPIEERRRKKRRSATQRDNLAREIPGHSINKTPRRTIDKPFDQNARERGIMVFEDGTKASGDPRSQSRLRERSRVYKQQKSTSSICNTKVLATNFKSAVTKMALPVPLSLLRKLESTDIPVLGKVREFQF